MLSSEYFWSRQSFEVDRGGIVWTDKTKYEDSTAWSYKTEGIWRFRNGAWEVFPLPLPGDYYWAEGVFLDELRTPWLTTTCGLVRMDGDSGTIFRTNTPYQVALRNVVEDADHTIWFGGSLIGASAYLSSFDGATWKNYVPGEERMVDAQRLTVDRNNRKWIIEPDGDLIRFDGETWKTEIAGGSYPFGTLYLNEFAVDPAGNVWFPYSKSGIWRWDGSAWTQYTVEHGLGANSAYAVAVAPDGNLWAATADGLSQFDGQTWKSISFGKKVDRIAFAANGVIWCAADSGLIRCSGPEWTEITEIAGMSNPRFLSLAVDENHILWACSPDEGVVRFDGREWKWLTTADGLLSNSAYAVMVDHRNRKWFSTSGGYCVLDDSGLSATSTRFPGHFALYQNSPNPFNPNTTISFSLPAPGRVNLSVYSITGQKVRELLSDRTYRSYGTYRVVWDGKNDDGKAVSSGIYIARLESGGRVHSRKMLLMK
jgi:ligand-binding sensor domain-containing protein